MTRADAPPHGRTPDVAIATVGAVAAAALVAIACLSAPSRLMEALIVRSGIAALVNAAAPPLGFTARLVLAAGSGVLVGAVGWAILVLVVGERRIGVRAFTAAWPRLPQVRARALPAGQTVRRADSHPDAPPRPPILAERELGLPFLSIVAPADVVAAVDGFPISISIAIGQPAGERPLPADLDTALAAVDPAAIPDVPREPVRPVATLTPPPPASSSLHRPVPLAPGEWIDSVQLTSDVRDQPDSIEALLSRLERGTRRRPMTRPTAPIEQATVSSVPPTSAPEPAAAEPAPSPPPPPSGSLAETLGQLRRLATRT